MLGIVVKVSTFDDIVSTQPTCPTKTHMGLMWAYMWAPYGLPISDPHNFGHGLMMGPMWAAQLFHKMGPRWVLDGQKLKIEYYYNNFRLLLYFIA